MKIRRDKTMRKTIRRESSDKDKGKGKEEDKLKTNDNDNDDTTEINTTTKA